MSLETYRELFLGKRCGIDWSIGENRKNASISKNTEDVVVSSVYENCYGDVLATFEDKITAPVSVKKLYLM